MKRMRGFAVGVLAGTLLGGVAIAQSAKPSPYEGVAEPSNTPEDVQISTPAAAPTAATTVQTQEPRYVIPDDAATTKVTTPTYTQAQADSYTKPELRHTPVTDPDADIVTAVPLKPGELAPGTVIKMRLDQALSTATTEPGTAFTGRVTEDVVQDGKVAIPTNAIIRGRVMYVSSGRRFRGPASIRLRPDEVVLPDNSRMTLHADVVDGDAYDTKTDSEGNIESKDHGKRTLGEAALVGGGAAAVGAEIAGVPGALIGGAVGAGIVTTHWLLEKHDATLPPDSEISLGLTEPMILSPLHP